MGVSLSLGPPKKREPILYRCRVYRPQGGVLCLLWSYGLKPGDHITEGTSAFSGLKPSYVLKPLNRMYTPLAVPLSKPINIALQEGPWRRESSNSQPLKDQPPSLTGLVQVRARAKDKTAVAEIYTVFSFSSFHAFGIYHTYPRGARFVCSWRTVVRVVHTYVCLSTARRLVLF